MLWSQDEMQGTPRPHDGSKNTVAKKASMDRSPARKRNKGRSALCVAKSDVNLSLEYSIMEIDSNSNPVPLEMSNDNSNNSLEERNTNSMNSAPFPKFINFSQESNASLSQFSQEFADRLGTMHMNVLSQEETNSTDNLFPSNALFREDSCESARIGGGSGLTFPEGQAKRDHVFLAPSLPFFRGGGKGSTTKTVEKKPLSAAFLPPQSIHENHCPNRMTTRSSSNRHSLPGPSSNSIESERQIDLPETQVNSFSRKVPAPAEYYFQDYLTDVGGSKSSSKRSSTRNTTSATTSSKMSKLWIGAYKERPRYYTDFEEVISLGEGTFSTVTCVRHRLDGLLYAIKSLKETMRSQKHRKLLLQEVQVLGYLNTIQCPHVLRYYQSWIYEDRLFVQVEVCPYGSLEDLLSSLPSKTSLLRAAWTQRDRSRPLREVYLTREKHSVGGGGGVGNAPESACGSQTQSDSDSQHDFLFLSSSSQSHPHHHQQQQQQQTVSSAFPLNLPSQGILEAAAWKILQKMSETLSFMHQRGLVHLDIRPANIFLQAHPQILLSNNNNHSASNSSLLRDDSRSCGSVSACSSSSTSSLAYGQSLFASILKAKPLGMNNDQTISTFEQEEDPKNTNNNNDGDDGSQKNRDSSIQTYRMIRQRIEEAIVKEDYELRLGDFGHARRLDDPSVIIEGETRYCARELIVENDFAPLSTTRGGGGAGGTSATSRLDLTKCDIFSLGASVYELCLGRFLLTNSQNSQSPQKQSEEEEEEGEEEGLKSWHEIREGQIDRVIEERYSPQLVSVLRNMLSPKPEERGHAATIFHRCCQYFHQNNEENQSSNGGDTSDLIQQLICENERLRKQLERAERKK